jgi:hypothetical protein
VNPRRLFSALQGTTWGEGGLFRAEESLVLDADLYATSVPAIAPCSMKASCEHGVYDADCNCVCNANWLAPTSGGPCTICTNHCTNGVLDKAVCSCACTAGYFGVNCGNYILGQWLSANLTKKQATIQFSWDLSADQWKGASKVSRYAALPADAQPQISGTSVAMPERKGTVTVALELASKITGYPANQFAYAVDLSLGTNEFGASKGFTKTDLPLFEYDAAKRCVKGGYLIIPAAPMATNPALCAGMVASPQNPTPVVTSIPTATPTVYRPPALPPTALLPVAKRTKPPAGAETQATKAAETYSAKPASAKAASTKVVETHAAEAAKTHAAEANETHPANPATVKATETHVTKVNETHVTKPANADSNRFRSAGWRLRVACACILCKLHAPTYP